MSFKSVNVLTIVLYYQDREEKVAKQRLSTSSVISPPPSQPTPSTSSMAEGEPEVIGAGLPLLQRLLLLKAKEEREKNQLTPTCSNQPSSSETISPSSIKSPLSPTVKNLSPIRKGSESSSPGKIQSPTTKTSRKNSSGSSDGTTRPKVSFKDKILQVQSDGTAVCQPLSKDLSEKPAAVVEPTQKSDGALISIPHSVVSKIKSPAKSVGSTFRDKLKILQSGNSTKENDNSSMEKTKTPTVTATEKAAAEINPVQSKEKQEELKSKKPWSKLKKAAILGESKSYSKSSIDEKQEVENVLKDPVGSNLSESVNISVPLINTAELVKIDSNNIDSQQDKPKSYPLEPVQEKSIDFLTMSPKKNIVTRSQDRIATTKEASLSKDKKYRSIDDLSPEYGGLPFVKKLKILNERQKLAELEKVIKIRSSSLDCTSSSEDLLCDTLTRSHSESSTMDKRKFKRKSTDSVESHGSNETLERRTLKSILKKLSEDVTPTESPEKSNELRKLIRAPTIEGYAARHSKFAKSVTFHRHTLPSPPGSIPMDMADEVFEMPTPVEIKPPTTQTSDIKLPDSSELHQTNVNVNIDPKSIRNANDIETNIKTQYKLQSNIDPGYDYKSLRPEDIRVPEKPKLTIISAVANQRKLLRGTFIINSDFDHFSYI